MRGILEVSCGSLVNPVMSSSVSQTSDGQHAYSNLLQITLTSLSPSQRSKVKFWSTFETSFTLCIYFLTCYISLVRIKLSYEGPNLCNPGTL